MIARLATQNISLGRPNAGHRGRIMISKLIAAIILLFTAFIVPAWADECIQLG